MMNLEKITDTIKQKAKPVVSEYVQELRERTRGYKPRHRNPLNSDIYLKIVGAFLIVVFVYVSVIKAIIDQF